MPQSLDEWLVLQMGHVESQLSQPALQICGHLSNRLLGLGSVVLEVVRGIEGRAKDDENIAPEDGGRGIVEPCGNDGDTKVEVVPLLAFECDPGTAGLERQDGLSLVTNAFRKNGNGSAVRKQLETSSEGQDVLARFAVVVATSVNGQNSHRREKASQ